MFIDTSLDPDIISYHPKGSPINKLSGFYFNQETGYYEIWWTRSADSDEDDTIRMARIKNLKDIDTVLMEMIQFWNGSYDSILERATFH